MQRTYSTADMQFDGGSRGNPGPSAAAAWVEFCDGSLKRKASEYIGVATNNVAEYKALLVGLRLAREMDVKRLIIKGDSNLVVNHINGKWECNVPELRELRDEALGILNGFFVDWELSHVPRAQNREADALATETLDRIKRREKERTKGIRGFRR